MDSLPPPSLEPTWLAELGVPVRDQAEAALARARVGAAMFPENREPARVGRYVVLHRIGVGGMGIVYAAYDPELDRKVAIKVLHSGRGDSQESLLREARALARLSHAHVVGVHDVGTFELPARDDDDDDESTTVVFVAMEYVEGCTLTHWLAERTRSPYEVLDLLVQAGRGLAAAHAVGIVHRDFKPDNVLVDRDGQARVVDFGLAHAHDDTGRNDRTVSSIDEAPSPSSRDAETPMYGGTPAYMSPEQVSGVTGDARTDQYSFCVTLWEAIYRQRPFTGSSLVELATNIIEGNRRQPPRGVRVPRWLRSAITRGLAVDAEARWPTMDALMQALARGRKRARTLVSLAAVGALALAAATALGMNHLDEQRRLADCEAAGAAIANVWNDDERAAVRAGVLASGAGHAETTADKLMPWLDAQASAWQAARTEACVNANVKQTWGANLLDRSVWCLEDSRLELEALVAELRDPDLAAMTRAVKAAAGLQPVAPCRDQVLLERLPAPPTESRDEIQSVRAELSRAYALEATGAIDEAIVVARDGLRQAEEIGWPPLVASARVHLGTFTEKSGDYEEAERLLEEAYFEAARADAGEEVLGAAQWLIVTVGVRRGRYAEAERWFKLAEVARSKLPDPTGLREAASLNNLGLVREQAGDFAAAGEMFERARELWTEAFGPDHPSVAAATGNLAMLKERLGDYEGALELYARVQQLRNALSGPDHPEAANNYDNQGIVLQKLGRSEAGIEMHEVALRIRERAYGSEHPDVAKSLDHIATARDALGEHAAALALYERALLIREKTLGPDHPVVAITLNNIAVVHYRQGEFADAVALNERALAIRENALGPDNVDVAMSLNNLAASLRRIGEFERAKPFAARALAIREKGLGPDHPFVATTLNNLARIALATGAFDEAERLLQRALDIREKAFGETHAEVMAAIEDLAAAKLVVGDVAAADRLFARAHAIRAAAAR